MERWNKRADVFIFHKLDEGRYFGGPRSTLIELICYLQIGLGHVGQNGN